MNRKSFLVGLLAAGCFVATSTLMTSPGNAQADPKVAKAMAILKAETAKLGAPKAEGTDQTADKTTPGLYFGSTKVNNDFTIVDGRPDPRAGACRSLPSTDVGGATSPRGP